MLIWNLFVCAQTYTFDDLTPGTLYTVTVSVRASNNYLDRKSIRTRKLTHGDWGREGGNWRGHTTVRWKSFNYIIVQSHWFMLIKYVLNHTTSYEGVICNTEGRVDKYLTSCGKWKGQHWFLLTLSLLAIFSFDGLYIFLR